MQIRAIVFFLLVTLLGGCNNSFLPGMSGINVSSMRKIETPKIVNVNPVVIPITPSFLVKNPTSSAYIYHVAPQDVLNIFVWRHPEFNTPAQTTALNPTNSTQAAGTSGYLVNYKGKIYFPLVGYVDVGGKTIDEVQAQLTHRLRVYIPNPQVMVRVADYRSKKVYVLGEVMKPGLLPLNDQSMSIADALTLSGSFDPNAADTQHIYVIRGYFTHPTIYWLDARTPDLLLLAENFRLQPSDVIYVSSAVMTNWNRFLNEFMPTIQGYFYTQASIRNS